MKTILFTVLILSSAYCRGEENQIRLHYHVRPPLIDFDNGNLLGITGTLAVKIFENAKIPYSLLETPASRQLKILELNKGNDCAIGWFKNPEREAYAKFSEPIYHDKPQIALTQADHKNLKSAASLEELLGNSSFRILVKDNYSYGPIIDKMIKESAAKIDRTAIESMQMVEMVRQKRVDFMFVTQEEADDVISKEKPTTTLKAVKITNAPAGEYRHIICSKNISDSVMKKLNQSIKQIVKLK